MQTHIKYITNQKLLAASVGITEQHLTGIKNGQRGASVELLSKLEALTGIKAENWYGTRKKSLNKRLQRFFRHQLDELHAIKQLQEKRACRLK